MADGSTPQQDHHRRAMELYDDAKECWRENHQRMLEDLRFSNPADPQQWDTASKLLRKGRIMHTHDRTNQYKQQVVNSARKNKPGIVTAPADSRGDVEVAKRIDGVLRHIEYSSRSHIAYDTAIGHAADCGIGWIMVVPRVIRQYENHQEWRIERVIDPLSVMLLNSTEPDGSDATDGFAETLISKKQFKATYPEANPMSWGDGSTNGWVLDDMVRICTHQYVVETDEKWVTVANPETQEELNLSAKDYEELTASIGYSPPITREFVAKKRRVMAETLSGSEVLEETEFPSSWIGMVPVIGYETYVDGKRYLCGLTRRLRDSQIDYNFQRSAGTESIALQPKAPLLTPIEAMVGHEEHYANLNSGNPALLPFNAYDGEGRPIPKPERVRPPDLPTSYIQGAQQALSDMEAAIGMLRTSGDAPPASASGRALRERAISADTATFHFPDNQSTSIEQVGRIIVSGFSRIYDTRRVVRIIGEDGNHDAVTVDPEMPQAVERRGGKVVAVNFNVGEYDVRIKTGPSYTSQRESAAEGIEQILSAAPQFTAVLGPQLVKLRDFPDADKTARMMVATLPPQMQKIFNEGDDGDPHVTQQKLQAAEAQIEQMQQAGQQLQQQVSQMQQALAEKQTQTQIDMQAAQSKAQTDQLNAQVKVAELRLKERELDLKEREMALRELEAQNKPPADAVSPIDQGNLEINARKVEIDAFNAETARLKVELDALIAKTPPAAQAAQVPALEATVEALTEDEAAVSDLATFITSDEAPELDLQPPVAESTIPPT